MIRRVRSAAYIISQSYRRKVRHPDSNRTGTARQRSKNRRAIRQLYSAIAHRGQ